MKSIFRILLFLITVFCSCEQPEVKVIAKEKNQEVKDYEIIVGSFLGNETRNYYGDFCSDSLSLIWKFELGKGETIVNEKSGVEIWSGAGWTGQPLITNEKGSIYVYQASFDHTLKKINLSDGSLVWQYQYDDILKGTGTIWMDKSVKKQNPFYIFQGSRKGVKISLKDSAATSFRAIKCENGQEVWRMPMLHTRCYSNDVDASPLFVNDTGYIGLENGFWVAFDPLKKNKTNKGYDAPTLYSQSILYSKEDAHQHGGNLVTEASPARLGNHLYIASGCGHVFGYNLNSRRIDWDFYIGSDMDGTPVVTSDNCILISVEKQYIKGHGGVFKLDPNLPPSQCVKWYYPTEDKKYSSWEGGVIGSCSVNDNYKEKNQPYLAAFTGIDGYLTVVRYKELADSLVYGPDGSTKYPCPKVQYREKVCSSISTPIFSKNHLVMAGYGSVNIYKITPDAQFVKTASRRGYFESTPVCFGGSVLIASRDGNLYNLGINKNSSTNQAQEPSITQNNNIDKRKVEKFNKHKSESESEKYPRIKVDEKLYKKVAVFNNIKKAQKAEEDYKKQGKTCLLNIKRKHKIELYIKRK